MTPRPARRVLAALLLLCLSSLSWSGAERPVEWGAFVAQIAPTPAGAELAKSLNLNFTLPGTAQNSFISMMDRLRRYDDFKPSVLPAAASEQAAAIQQALVLYSQDLRNRSEAALKAGQPAQLQVLYAEHALLNRVSPALPMGTAAAMAVARKNVSSKIEADTREELEAQVVLAVKDWRKGGFGGLLKELKGGVVDANQSPDPGKAAFLGAHKLAGPKAVENRLGPLEAPFNKLRSLQKDGLFKITSPNARDILNDAAAALEKSDLSPSQRVEALKAFITGLYSIDVLTNKVILEEAGGLSYRTPTGIFQYDGKLTPAHSGVDEALVAVNTAKLMSSQFSGNAVGLTMDPRFNYRNGILLALSRDGVIKAFGQYRDRQGLERQGEVIVELTVRVLQGDAVESIDVVKGALSDVAKKSLLAAVENRNRSMLEMHPEFSAALAKEPLPEGEALWKKTAPPPAPKPAPRTARQELEGYFAEIEGQYPKGMEIASSDKKRILNRAVRLAERYSTKNDPRGEQEALWGFLSRMSADENGYFRKDMEYSDKGLFYTRSDGGVFKYNPVAHAFEPAKEASLAVLESNLKDLSRLMASRGPGSLPVDIAVRADGRILGFAPTSRDGVAAIVRLIVRSDGLVLDASVARDLLAPRAFNDLLGVIERRNARLGFAAAPDQAVAVALSRAIRSPSSAFTGIGGQTSASAYVDRRTGEFLQWADRPLESPEAVYIELKYSDNGGVSWLSSKNSPWDRQPPLSARAKANLEAAIRLVNGRRGA